jgi:hypothetical protein
MMPPIKKSVITQYPKWIKIYLPLLRSNMAWIPKTGNAKNTAESIP